jgi:Flp pilus assembly CpaE family ATPase
MWRALAQIPIWHLVTDADAEILMGDEAKRQLYADLVEHTIVPPLRELANIVATKMHLASLFNIAKLDKMLPGLGQSWACKATLYNIFVDQAVYARQFQAVSAWMQAGDWSLLCPTSPDMSVVLSFTILQMKEAAGKKELALLGASTGKGTLAASAYQMAGGVEEETAAVDT